MTKAMVGADVNSEPDMNWAEAAFYQVCAEAGLDPAGAKLIKFTNNAVYALESKPIVVRIAGSVAVRDRVPNIIAAARWLARNDMPTVRLAEEYPQPLELDHTAVTFWHRVDRRWIGPHPNGFDLGRILRRFHALATPQFDLPQWDPLRSIRRRVEDEDVLSQEDHQFLVRTCDELDHALTSIDYLLPSGPIHGDAFIGNLIAAPSGAVLCDFDSVAEGPREWDLTPIALGSLRFDYGADYHAQLVSEYGIDVTQWQHFPVLSRLRELQLVTSVLPTLRSNPSLFNQWSLRFASFRDGDRSAVWTTYR